MQEPNELDNRIADIIVKECDVVPSHTRRYTYDRCENINEEMKKHFLKNEERYERINKSDNFVGIKIQAPKEFSDMMIDIKRKFNSNRLSGHSAIEFGLIKLLDSNVDIDSIILVGYDKGYNFSIHVMQDLYKILSDLSVYFRTAIGNIAVSCLKKTFDEYYQDKILLKNKKIQSSIDQHSLKGICYLKSIGYSDEDIVTNTKLIPGKADLTTLPDNTDWEVKIFNSNKIYFTDGQLQYMDLETNILIFENNNDLVPKDVIKFKDIIDGDDRYHYVVRFIFDLNDANEIIDFVNEFMKDKKTISNISKENINLSIKEYLKKIKIDNK